MLSEGFDGCPDLVGFMTKIICSGSLLLGHVAHVLDETILLGNQVFQILLESGDDPFLGLKSVVAMMSRC